MSDIDRTGSELIPRTYG